MACTHAAVMVLTTTKVVPGPPAASAPSGPGQHGVDLLVVDHGHHHHVGGPGQFGRRGATVGVVRVTVGGLGPDVADHQGESGRGHAGGHPVADGAEADHPDGRRTGPRRPGRSGSSAVTGLARCCGQCRTRTARVLDQCPDYSPDTMTDTRSPGRPATAATVTARRRCRGRPTSSTSRPPGVGSPPARPRSWPIWSGPPRRRPRRSATPG